MILGTTFMEDFTCNSKEEFPSDAPLGFVSALVDKEADRTTLYLFTGDDWVPVKSFKTSQPQGKVNFHTYPKIPIYRNGDGDTRTANPNVSYDDFHTANLMHKSDVYRLMNLLANMIEDAGRTHDFTKIDSEQAFFMDFQNTLALGGDFTKKPWYRSHINNERHHLNDRCPEDVNLIDVLEMISDCCAAGAARTGAYSPINLSDEILRKAFENTIELIKESIIITS